MQIANFLLGLVVLLFGRPLYWAFVAIVGFLVGALLAESLLAEYEQWVQLLAAIAAGVFGALLAVVAIRVGFAIAGFFAAGYLAVAGAQEFAGGENLWLWFVIAGAIGAVVAALVMDWAIIVLSSLVGAGAMVRSLELEPRVGAIAFVVLAVVGMIVQANLMRRRARPVARS